MIPFDTSVANRLQAECIRRYHRHLLRRRPISLEHAGREWIGRYAKLWRQHFWCKLRAEWVQRYRRHLSP